MRVVLALAGLTGLMGCKDVSTGGDDTSDDTSTSRECRSVGVLYNDGLLDWNGVEASSNTPPDACIDLAEYDARITQPSSMAADESHVFETASAVAGQLRKWSEDDGLSGPTTEEVCQAFETQVQTLSFAPTGSDPDEFCAEWAKTGSPNFSCTTYISSNAATKVTQDLGASLTPVTALGGVGPYWVTLDFDESSSPKQAAHLIWLPLLWAAFNGVAPSQLIWSSGGSWDSATILGVGYTIRGSSADLDAFESWLADPGGGSVTPADFAGIDLTLPSWVVYRQGNTVTNWPATAGASAGTLDPTFAWDDVVGIINPCGARDAGDCDQDEELAAMLTEGLDVYDSFKSVKTGRPIPGTVPELECDNGVDVTVYAED